MFKSDTMYTNRYSDNYMWEAVDDNVYKFVMDEKAIKFCRYGGKEGDTEVDRTDLGMFDPSGGPYVCLGMKIDGKPITRLSTTEDGFRAECSEYVYPGGDCQE